MSLHVSDIHFGGGWGRGGERERERERERSNYAKGNKEGGGKGKKKNKERSKVNKRPKDIRTFSSTSITFTATSLHSSYLREHAHATLAVHMCKCVFVC